MTGLTLVLILKIAGTLIGVGLPMLLLPKAQINALFGTETSSGLIYRLYGMAVVALCVGYAFGIPIAQQGDLPLAVVTMGLVSNGGAVLLLALHKKNRLQWIGLIFLSGIVLGLAASLLTPALMLTPL